MLQAYDIRNVSQCFVCSAVTFLTTYARLQSCSTRHVTSSHFFSPHIDPLLSILRSLTPALSYRLPGANRVGQALSEVDLRKMSMIV